LVQVFERGVTQDQVILMAARASRIENQDAIDTAIVGMLADPKEVYCLSNRDGISMAILFIRRWEHLTIFSTGTCWYSRGSFPAI